MKVFVFLAVVAYSQAGVILNNAVPVAVAETGVSSQTNSQDNLGNYAFSYDEGHTTGGTFRKEVGDAAGNKAGSYGLRDIDGRIRVVNYVADAAGFRADIKTNEPGVDDTQDPADTVVNKELLVARGAVAVPVVSHSVAAPVVSHAVAAPVAPLAPFLHSAVFNAPLLHSAHLLAPVNGFSYSSAISHLAHPLASIVRTW